MTTHIRIRRVLEQYRLGPADKGGVGIGELASLIEEALDLRARDEVIAKESWFQSSRRPRVAFDLDDLIAKAESKL